ncbi:MAG: hypothetical protein HY657_00860 [Acidobacteria bacterium]|nr:hypothetical protein [Acidobacteriota bacterium]
MARGAWVLIGGLVLVTAAVVIGSASRDQRHDDAQSQVVYAPTATIKDLMDAVVDPSADDVWNAVSTTVDKGGVSEKVPRTDQEWGEVRP